MHPDSRIFVAGHSGLVGSAIRRSLKRQGFNRLLLKTHCELDLTDKAAVQSFFQDARPEFVLLAAAKVGGILANQASPADFLRQNLEIQTNVIDACHRFNVERVLFLASTSIYPRDCPQPMKEEYLLTGYLDPSNRPYALAKIAGVEMCGACNQQYGTKFLAAAPTNLYGPGDNYQPDRVHMLPALLRRIAHAKAEGQTTVTVWGTGNARRELLYSDDLADACVFLMNLDDARFDSLLPRDRAPLVNIGSSNIGSGNTSGSSTSAGNSATDGDMSIRQIAETICRVLGYSGELVFDLSKPDGAPRKLTDSSRMRALGWQPKVTLEAGIALTWQADEKTILSSSA